MVSKLVILALGFLVAAVSSEIAENDWKSEQENDEMRPHVRHFKSKKPRCEYFLRPREEKSDCIKKCQSDCKGSDYNCCHYPGTTKHMRCRTIAGTYRDPKYQCVHPDLHYNAQMELVNNVCNNG